MNAPFDLPTITQPALAVERYRSDYRAARGLDPVSVAGALVVMAGAIAMLMTMSDSRHHPHQSPRTVFAMLEVPRTSPPPPRPRGQPKVVTKDPPPVSGVVAPVPQVVTPAPTPAVSVAQAAAPPRVAVAAAPASPAPNAPPEASGPANGGDLSGKMLSAKPPSYPIDARRAHEQGTVVLAVLLGTTGRVEDISVVQSSGSARVVSYKL